MEDSKNKQSLKEKWGSFLIVLLDPWVVLMLLATIVFLYYSTQTTDKNILALITLIISIVSGLLGGIIANRWAQMTELKVMVARGKSAIRSLKLILLNISNVEKRTKEYITCIDKDNKEYKLITSNFEEVIEKCNILQEEIISSIENWTDIIPEVANLKTQIGVISDMKLKQAQLEDDISGLNENIKAIREEGSKEKEEIQNKLTVKEADLDKTKLKLKEAESKINTSILSGITISNSWETCKGCGTFYQPSGIKLINDHLCDNCRPNTRLVLPSRQKK
jgi:hypothetical protein